ncbi:MAG: PucR family transcriptional regulator ligand-binding domain-containing protein [Clostridiales bacterium]|nr:PucR family transcriptional regulator ligand-binding domain-containing protein [Clostridiales bacterium]
MTLQQLYNEKGTQFKLSLLAGQKGLHRNVTKIYYLEDLLISDWTRDGELIVTTAMMNTKEPDWILKFVKSVQPFHPCGIMINIGGYLEEVPANVIEYCDQVDLPLFSFPWEVILQDLISDITVYIFETEQLENNISKAFFNAIFTPDNRDEYETCLEKYQFDQYDTFFSAIFDINSNDLQRRRLTMRLKNLFHDAVLIQHLRETILVFCQSDSNDIANSIAGELNEWQILFPNTSVRVGIGSPVCHYQDITNSYQKAKLSLSIAKNTNKSLVSFSNLGILGILATGEKQLLQSYYDQTLTPLEEYDQAHDTAYINTLENYIFCNCDAGAAAEKLFIHRNTLNYRLRKISDITGDNLSEQDVIFRYHLAFLIKKCL